MTACGLPRRIRHVPPGTAGLPASLAVLPTTVAVGAARLTGQRKRRQ